LTRSVREAFLEKMMLNIHSSRKLRDLSSSFGVKSSLCQNMFSNAKVHEKKIGGAKKEKKNEQNTGITLSNAKRGKYAVSLG